MGAASVLGKWRRCVTCAWHLGVLVCACGAARPSLADESPQNWFGDPFVQVSAAVAACPEPLGPRMSASERLAQSHHRAERGTTCFLRGECEQPNAYRYDADIAAALVPLLRRNRWAQAATLWVTVQGRIVYLEGCSPAPAHAAAEWERLARSVPQVTQVMSSVYTGRGRVPYPVWRPGEGGLTPSR